MIEKITVEAFPSHKWFAEQPKRDMRVAATLNDLNHAIVDLSLQQFLSYNCNQTAEVTKSNFRWRHKDSGMIGRILHILVK